MLTYNMNCSLTPLEYSWLKNKQVVLNTTRFILLLLFERLLFFATICVNFCWFRFVRNRLDHALITLLSISSSVTFDVIGGTSNNINNNDEWALGSQQNNRNQNCQYVCDSQIYQNKIIILLMDLIRSRSLPFWLHMKLQFHV